MGTVLKVEVTLLTPFPEFGIRMWKWSGLALNDVGDDLVIPYRADRSFHFYGVLGGASLRVEGSNELSAPTNYSLLKDIFGVDASVIAGPWIVTIGQNVYRIRPAIVGGGGTTAITVVALIRGSL